METDLDSSDRVVSRRCCSPSSLWVVYPVHWVIWSTFIVQNLWLRVLETPFSVPTLATIPFVPNPLLRFTPSSTSAAAPAPPSPHGLDHHASAGVCRGVHGAIESRRYPRGGQRIQPSRNQSLTNRFCGQSHVHARRFHDLDWAFNSVRPLLPGNDIVQPGDHQRPRGENRRHRWSADALVPHSLCSFRGDDFHLCHPQT